MFGAGHAEIYFRRRIPVLSLSLVMVCAAGGLGVGARLLQEDLTAVELIGWSLAASLGVGGLFGLLALLPIVGEGTLIRLTGEGLRIGRRNIVLKDVALVQAVSPEELLQVRTFGWLVGEKRIGMNKKKVGHATRHAILFWDANGGKRPWWIVDVGNIEDFMSSLQRARECAHEAS